MTSKRPYLVKAFYNWIVDNHLTPYLLVDATHSATQVPHNHVQEGKITLNVAPLAIRCLEISLKSIEFEASFSGEVTIIYVPMPAVLALYAHENGQGVVFTEEHNQTAEEPSTLPQAKPKKKPKLTVIK